MTLNWRDASFEPFDPVDARARRARVPLRYGGGPSASADAAADETRLSSAPPPSLANVVPGSRGEGTCCTSRDAICPRTRARRAVGASLAPASAVSSALILCDPLGGASPAASRLAGGVTEISLGVTSAAAPRRAADLTALSVFVLERAAVVGVDVGNGWEQGGGSVSVELNGWAPAGWMDCRFGTVTVHAAPAARARARRSSGRAASGGRKRRRRWMSSASRPRSRRGAFRSAYRSRTRPRSRSTRRWNTRTFSFTAVARRQKPKVIRQSIFWIYLSSS